MTTLSFSLRTDLHRDAWAKVADVWTDLWAEHIEEVESPAATVEQARSYAAAIFSAAPHVVLPRQALPALRNAASFLIDEIDRGDTAEQVLMGWLPKETLAYERRLRRYLAELAEAGLA